MRIVKIKDKYYLTDKRITTEPPKQLYQDFIKIVHRPDELTESDLIDLADEEIYDLELVSLTKGKIMQVGDLKRDPSCFMRFTGNYLDMLKTTDKVLKYNIDVYIYLRNVKYTKTYTKAQAQEELIAHLKNFENKTIKA